MFMRHPKTMFSKSIPIQQGAADASRHFIPRKKMFKPMRMPKKKNFQTFRQNIFARESE